MIIILFPYKFTNFFAKKYQIDVLKKKLKNKIEVHDLSNIVSKKWNKIFDKFHKRRNKSAIVFNEMIEWKSYLKKKIKKKKNFFVINLISSNSFQSFYIHYLLFKYKIKIIKLNSPEVYAPAQKKNLYLRLLSFTKILFLNFPRFWLITNNFVYNRLLFFLKFDQLYIFFCGSKKYLLPFSENSKKLSFVNYHASDYANYLSNKKKYKQKEKKNYVVLLDIKAPAFYGDDFLFNNKIKYDVDRWYEDLNNFLDKVEKKFKTNVIIIPHPSVRKLKNIYYSKRFKVAKDPDATNKLIPNSKFVIANGATTAVSYCVIHNKPVTFIYNDQVIKFNPTMLFEINNLCKTLSSKKINIDKNFGKKEFSLMVNKSRYLKYKYNFLTSKKIKNISNSEILKKLIS